MPINMSWKCYVLVQRKCVQNVQERPGINTGFVQNNIATFKDGLSHKAILKLLYVHYDLV